MKSEGNTHVCLIIDTICELRRVYYFCCWCWWFYYFFSLISLSLSLSVWVCVSLFSFFLFVRFLLIFASNFFRIFFSLVLYRCAWRDVNDVCVREGFFSLLPILKSEMLGYIVCTSGYQRWPLLFYFLFRLFFFLCMLVARDVIATRTYMMPKYHSMSAQETRCVNSNMMAYFVFSLVSFFFFLLAGRFFSLDSLFSVMFLVCKAAAAAKKTTTSSEKNKSAHKTDISKQEWKLDGLAKFLNARDHHWIYKESRIIF